MRCRHLADPGSNPSGDTDDGATPELSPAAYSPRTTLHPHTCPHPSIARKNVAKMAQHCLPCVQLSAEADICPAKLISTRYSLAG